jgi:uncharacterized protein involved in outer membrane biogenesis
MRTRNVLLSVAGVVVALLVAAVIVASRVDLNQYVGIVEAKVRDLTGRELKIKGNVGFRLSLLPTVAAGDVSFQNAGWGSRPAMATARRVDIQVALLPLLTGNVVVKRITLVEPDVLLQVDAKGRRNWDLASTDKAAAPKAAASADEAAPLQVRRVTIEKGLLTYRDARSKSEYRAALDSLDLQASAGYEAVSVDGAGSVNDLPVLLRGSVDGLAKLGEAGAKGNVELQIHAGAAKVTLKGDVPLAAGLSGLDARFAAEIADTATLARALRTDLPALPATKLSGRARVAKNLLTLENLEAASGKSRANGALKLALQGERREFAARLDAPLLDLQELYAAGTKSPGQPKPARSDGRVFSADPLPVATLKALEGKAELHVEKLRLADGRVAEGIGARFVFKQGKIVGEEVKIRLDGRDLRLNLDADASSGKDLAVSGAVAGEKIPLAALTGVMGMAAAPEGAPTDVAVQFSGRGGSVRALMASANGNVRIAIGPGRIKNRAIDFGADVTELLNALNPARNRDEYSDLKCAVLRFPVRNGIATIDNGIAAETSKVRLLGGGTVNLRTEQLELGFRPAANSGLGVGVGGLARFAKVGGTLADPQVGLDMAGASGAAAAAGAAVLTGGLSLLVGGGLLLDSVPENVCQVALTGAPKARSKQDSGGSIFDPIKKFFGN